jgi:hypothetical protein
VPAIDAVPEETRELPGKMAFGGAIDSHTGDCHGIDRTCRIVRLETTVTEESVLRVERYQSQTDRLAATDIAVQVEIQDEDTARQPRQFALHEYGGASKIRLRRLSSLRRADRVQEVDSKRRRRTDPAARRDAGERSGNPVGSAMVSIQWRRTKAVAVADHA